MLHIWSYCCGTVVFLIYLLLGLQPGWVEVILGLFFVGYFCFLASRLGGILYNLRERNTEISKKIRMDLINDDTANEHLMFSLITACIVIASSLLMLFANFFGYLLVFAYAANMNSNYELNGYIRGKWARLIEKGMTS